MTERGRNSRETPRRTAAGLALVCAAFNLQGCASTDEEPRASRATPESSSPEPQPTEVVVPNITPEKDAAVISCIGFTATRITNSEPKDTETVTAGSSRYLLAFDAVIETNGIADEDMQYAIILNTNTDGKVMPSGDVEKIGTTTTFPVDVIDGIVTISPIVVTDEPGRGSWDACEPKTVEGK